MKKILMMALVLATTTTWASEKESMKCTTELKTEMIAVYQNGPARIISLSIGGADYTGKVESFRFGSEGPVFSIRNFPHEGQMATFSLKTWQPKYEVGQINSYYTKANSLECEDTTIRQPKADNIVF